MFVALCPSWRSCMWLWVTSLLLRASATKARQQASRMQEDAAGAAIAMNLRMQTGRCKKSM